MGQSEQLRNCSDQLAEPSLEPKEERIRVLTSRWISRAAPKAYEDSLDALICARVGMKHLIGKARALGDETGAIWVSI